jgi:hypothetical protein
LFLDSCQGSGFNPAVGKEPPDEHADPAQPPHRRTPGQVGQLCGMAEAYALTRGIRPAYLRKSDIINRSFSFTYKTSLP